MAREYFCAYHSYLRSMRKLSDAECGRLFRALLQYSAGEQLIKLQGREEAVFDFMTDQIDRDNEKYEAKCARNRENGKKRTAPNASDRCRTLANGGHNKDKGKDKDKDECNPLTPFEGASAELSGIFQQWLTYKSERREGYKPTGLKSLQAQIQRAAVEYGDHAVAQLITECMAANWKGIIFDRLKDTSRKPKPSGNVFYEIAMEGGTP